MFADFFQTGPIDSATMVGTYSLPLVAMSILVAVAASYVALDLVARLRDISNTKLNSILWLVGGSIAMGAGIWSMHFIGMLAFSMPMNMQYDKVLTVISMLCGVIASGYALYILKSPKVRVVRLALGGAVLGIAICMMHYMGMAAMNMHIRYWPGIFIFSILLAIAISEVAIILIVLSNKGSITHRLRMKCFSALVMGIAICSMHYTGMAAAVFIPDGSMIHTTNDMGPDELATLIAITTFIILGITFAISTYKESSNSQKIQLAHQQGMAEVASNVLHNIGNVMNSVNVSAAMIQREVTSSELSGIVDLNDLLAQHKDNLSDFLKTPQGSQVPAYIEILATTYKRGVTVLTKESQELVRNLKHIEDIIAMQQSLSTTPKMIEKVIIEDVLNEALKIASIESCKTDIVIKKVYEDLEPIKIEKSKIMQILINLIRNAKHSLIETNIKRKTIILKVAKSDKDNMVIEVSDNGLGIPHENMGKIFTHGFTTKKNGHGFGLHASAISATEMGGGLRVASEGVGKGATFTLEIPYITA